MKLAIILSCLIATAACAALHAAEVAIPPAPLSAFADTESVTNAPLGAALARARFLHSALAFARTETVNAGVRCSLQSIHLAGPVPWHDTWTGLTVALDPLSPAGEDEEASAKLSIGLSGTNGFDLAWFDREIAFHAKWKIARRHPDGTADYTNAIGIVATRREDMAHSSFMHREIGGRFIVLEIPLNTVFTAQWGGLWQSATNAFERVDWSMDVPSVLEPGDEEAWGLDFFPRFMARAAEAGLEQVSYCCFDSRESIRGNRVAYARSGPPLDTSKAPGWRLHLVARREGSEDNWSRATLFVGKEDDGYPIEPADWRRCVPDPGMIRYRKANGRGFILCPYTDDPVWDDILDR